MEVRENFRNVIVKHTGITNHLCMNTYLCLQSRSRPQVNHVSLCHIYSLVDTVLKNPQNEGTISEKQTATQPT